MQQTTRGWRERLAVVLGCLSARCGEAGPRCELEFGRRRVVVRPRGCMSRRVAGLPDGCETLLVSYRSLARFFGCTPLCLVWQARLPLAGAGACFGLLLLLCTAQANAFA